MSWREMLYIFVRRCREENKQHPDSLGCVYDAIWVTNRRSQRLDEGCNLQSEHHQPSS